MVGMRIAGLVWYLVNSVSENPDREVVQNPSSDLECDDNGEAGPFGISRPREQAGPEQGRSLRGLSDDESKCSESAICSKPRS